MLEVEAIAFGVPVHAISASPATGSTCVRAHLAPGRTVALLGSSGVGKSTLVNALPARSCSRRSRSANDGEGRHTTAHRELVLLPGGGLVLDTPGMRELQLWDRRTASRATFGDVEELAAQCRFSDCAHRSEPGCAVLAALRDGTLASRALVSYNKLQRELAHLERRLDKRLQAEERKR